MLKAEIFAYRESLPVRY